MHSNNTHWPCSRTNRIASAMFLAWMQKRVIFSSVAHTYIYMLISCVVLVNINMHTYILVNSNNCKSDYNSLAVLENKSNCFGDVPCVDVEAKIVICIP